MKMKTTATARWHDAGMHKRTDTATAAVIDQAIVMATAGGAGPAAAFLYSRCVPIWIAHRVLVRPARRRALLRTGH